MKRPIVHRAKHEKAWIWLIIRIRLNDLAMTNNRKYGALFNLTLEHAPYRVSAKLDRITIHSPILSRLSINSLFRSVDESLAVLYR